MARHADLPLAGALGSHTQAQRGEQALDLGTVHVHAQHLADALGTQGDRRNVRQVGGAGHFDDRAGFAADDLQQQRSGALHGIARQLRVHTTLEAVRGVGVQAIGAGLAGHRDGVEEGAFEEQVAGLAADTAVLATHHAGDGQGAVVVGDHQGVGAQADFLAIQQDQLLALFRHAHADAAVDLGEVEGVHRLAEFEHHVVGDVDGGVDAADIGTAQALDHPQRSRLGQVDATDHATQVARAGLGRQHFDRAHFVMRGGDRRDGHRGDRRAVDGTDFAGQAGQRQAVASVGGQADLDAGIVQAQVGTDVLADRGISRQLHQAAVVVADLQLGGRAEHALGLHAAQLGLLDLEVARQLGADHGEGNLDAGTGIRRTADHLEAGATVADLAHAQLVGVRVLFGTEDLAHHHAAELASDRDHGVHFQADHGQAGHQFVARNVRIYPAAQPLFTEFHAVCSPLSEFDTGHAASGIAPGTAGRYRRTGASR